MPYQTRNHYLFLFLGLALGLFFFFNFPDFRGEIVIALCSFYFLWGVIHHWLNKDLHIKIILEYLLVALIGCLILLSLIWRAHQFFLKKGGFS
jgi:hypothetical protein